MLVARERPERLGFCASDRSAKVRGHSPMTQLRHSIRHGLSVIFVHGFAGDAGELDTDV